MNKTCTSCRWEPEWKDIVYPNNRLHGQCKKIPEFIHHSLYVYDDGNVYSVAEEYDDDKIIEDCNLWEAKP